MWSSILAGIQIGQSLLKQYQSEQSASAIFQNELRLSLEHANKRNNQLDQLITSIDATTLGYGVSSDSGSSLLVKQNYQNQAIGENLSEFNQLYFEAESLDRKIGYQRQNLLLNSLIDVSVF